MRTTGKRLRMNDSPTIDRERERTLDQDRREKGRNKRESIFQKNDKERRGREEEADETHRGSQLALIV